MRRIKELDFNILAREDVAKEGEEKGKDIELYLPGPDTIRLLIIQLVYWKSKRSKSQYVCWL